MTSAANSRRSRSPGEAAPRDLQEETHPTISTFCPEARPVSHDPRGGRGHTRHIDGIDVEPFLLAIRVGLFDDHLDSLVGTVEERVRALEAAAQLIASVTLKVGDRVQLGHNLEPLYLHGKTAELSHRMATSGSSVSNILVRPFSPDEIYVFPRFSWQP